MRFLPIFLLPSLVLANVAGIVVDNAGKPIPRAPLLYTHAGGEMYFAADSNGNWLLPFESGISRRPAAGAAAPSGKFRIQDEYGRLRVVLGERQADGSRISNVESGPESMAWLAPRMQEIVGESLFVDLYGGRTEHHSGIAISSHDTSGVVLTLNLDLHTCQNPDPTDSLLDCRDGQKYGLVAIAGRKWTSRNLSYAPADQYGVSCPMAIQNPSPDRYPACGDTLGFIYNSAYILKKGLSPRMICPEGSHVPRSGEWDSLVAALGGSKLADSVLRSDRFSETRTSATQPFVYGHYHNESGFGALYSDYRYTPSWAAAGVRSWAGVGWLVNSDGYPSVFWISSGATGITSADGAESPVRCILGK